MSVFLKNVRTFRTVRDYKINKKYKKVCNMCAIGKKSIKPDHIRGDYRMKRLVALYLKYSL